MNKVAQAKRDNWVFLWRIFAVGQVIGVTLGLLYVIYVSDSTAKFFHAYVMWIGPGFAFPLFSFSIRLMLNMQYRQIEQEEAFAELIKTVKDKEGQVEPVINKAVETVEKRVIPTVEKVAGVVDEATANGELKAAIEAIKTIPAKLDELRAGAKKNVLKNL